MIARLVKGTFLAACLTFATASAVIQTDPLPGGTLEAEMDGRPVQLPLLRTDMAARILGDLATVKLTQTFQNPYPRPLNARYIFPLPAEAAVHAMRLWTGDFVIEGQIREVRQAKAEFEQAKKQGKQAALVTQHRPNVFTQEVANLMPGASVKVELHYAHAVPKLDGRYEFTFPMVVGPRYLSDNGPMAGEPAAVQAGAWDLPDSPPVAPPQHIDPDRVGIEVHIEAGLPVQRLQSPTHPIDVAGAGAAGRVVRLASGRTLDNKDFVLSWTLAGTGTAAGVTTYASEGKGIVNLLIEPPAQAAEAELTPREMVFVLDCSGSMSGVPLEASKRFMRRALLGLRSTDVFRILRFSDTATAFSDRPLPATSENVQAGLLHLDGLISEGGTQMTSGIRAALDPDPVPGALRIVVFLTDGYIGNDVDVVRLIEQRRGQARLFSFGVGNGVNHYLLQEMARVGRGVARIVRPDQDAEAIADSLAKRLDAAYLTDVTIDWGKAPVHEPTPRVLPDLFLGQSLRVLARFEAPGTYEVMVHGKVAGRPMELPLRLELPSEAPEAEALPIVWARSQVEDRMIDYLSPARDEAERKRLQAEVTALGLKHRLVTQWTAFVAVARRVVNPAGKALDADVAVPQVEDLGEAAYPAQAFLGKAAPEPAEWAAMLLLAGLGLWWFRPAAAVRRRA
jgi:Ca-activated chloride channel family protein